MAHRKIRLKRSIIVKGEHQDKGSVLEAPAPLAHALVGDGSAEYHEDSKDEVDAENKAGVKVHDPVGSNADADVRVVSKPAAKKPATAEKDEKK